MARKFKIAVIDNDDSIRRALQRLLHSSGYSVETFSSAEEYLACDAVEHTDCLLLDLRLEGASGIQLQQRLVEMDRRVPTVFISSHQDENSRQAALQSGATDFLCKPVNTDELLDSIQKALELME